MPVDIADNIIYPTHATVMNMFGHDYIQFYRSIGMDADGELAIWFPNFCSHDEWHNQLIDNGTQILEGRHDGQNAGHIQWNIKHPQFHRRLVFGRIHVGEGYRFCGVFDFDLQASLAEGITTLRRVATRARTYP